MTLDFSFKIEIYRKEILKLKSLPNIFKPQLQTHISLPLVFIDGINGLKRFSSTRDIVFFTESESYSSEFVRNTLIDHHTKMRFIFSHTFSIPGIHQIGTHKSWRHIIWPKRRKLF